MSGETGNMFVHRRNTGGMECWSNGVMDGLLVLGCNPFDALCPLLDRGVEL